MTRMAVAVRFPSSAFRVGELRVVGNMAIRAHEQVPGIVQEQVHEYEARVTAVDGDPAWSSLGS